jgi:hypothetical protein
VLHQVGVSFVLYYDARKHKIKILSICHHPVFPQQFTHYTLISLLLLPDESALQFYNQNKKEILNIILPIAQETAEELITQIGDRILSSVPFSELLPA